MPLSLAQLASRTNPNSRRRPIVIRDIAPPASIATDLYRAVYAPVIALWTAAIPGIVAEYERTLATLTTDSPADVQAVIEAASADFDRVFIELSAALRDWAVKTERWQRNRWQAAVKASTQVDLGMLIGPAEVRTTLEQYIEWNVALVKDVSAQAQKRIADTVFAGLQNRTPVRDVARQIREAVDMGRRRATGIAADQTSKVAAALADERAFDVGLSVWRWRHSGKKHPRENHKVRDGNLYSDDKAMVGKTVDGQTVLAAPDASDQPGRPPWCGCRKQFVMVWPDE